MLTDNGKQFTGRFGKPRPAEVLFERICRKNGIKQLLTKPYSPTTTGKVERWHQTLQTDFLNDAGPFATIEAAQAAVDAWRHEYNHDRPHQSLDMATPASRFRPSPQAREDGAAACGRPRTWNPSPARHQRPATRRRCPEPASWPDAVEVDRVVPPSGNMAVGRQQFWLGPARAGQTGHPLDRHHHRAPEHRRVADQDRALPADRGGPGPAAPRRCPPRRAAARGPITRRAGRQQVRGSGPAGQRHRRCHPAEPADPGRLPAGRAAGPHPPRRPADARHHPRRGAVAHPALPHPTRPAAPPAGRPPGRARPAARSRPHRAAAGLLPRRHPGRPPAHPGRA